MIEDVTELSVSEEIRRLARRHFLSYIFKCIWGVLASTAILTLFAVFMTSNFSRAFSPECAEATSGRVIVTFILLLVFMFAMYNRDVKDDKGVRNFWISIVTVTISVILSITGSKVWNMFAMPIAFASLVVLELMGTRYSILNVAVTGILITVSFLFSLSIENVAAPETVDGISSALRALEGNYDTLLSVVTSVVCNSLSACVMCFFAHKHYTRFKFLVVAILLPLSVQPLVVMSALAMGDTSINILWDALFSYGADVLAALLFMPIVFLFEGVFNIADDFRLSELCNLSNPLLKRLASEAPGTFNHSLVVGTIAEACASAIGENPNLARCAAYYHDIGKLKAPLYFSENQSDYNPHDELIPEVSVSMITSHTLFGEILAKQARMPSEIVSICRQHHGTAPVSYFFNKANNLQEEGDLAQDNYTYAGPRPQTKVAAIIMICDTVEAAIRSFTPETREGYVKRIELLVDDKIRLKQFDECPITLGDIAIIKKTLLESLTAMHHGRIDYDKKKRRAAKA